MVGEGDEVRAPGRPRDEGVGPAILAATRRLVAEHGYDGVTTRMIAAAAGAGKQTLYRRWPSKAELVLDAYLSYAQTTVDQPAPPSGPAAQRIAEFLRRTFAALADTAPAVRGLMATAQHDPEFRDAFRTRFIEPRRQALRHLLADAIADGLLPPGADVEIATIALYGAVWYRLLLDEPMGADYAERLAALIVGGLAAAPAGHRPDHAAGPRN